MSDLALSKAATFRVLATNGIGENSAVRFFDEVTPATPYQGGMWTLKQINKWSKANKAS